MKNFTIEQAIKALKTKQVSATELVNDYINNINTKNDLNCFVTKTFEQALEQAKIADDNIAKNQTRPLEGVVIANKDLYCTQNTRTTACSKMLENFTPHYESSVTQNLKNAGSISLGKLNMDEFAMGSANLNSYFGAVKNPWKSKTEPNKDFVPGGSSGGSAAAVAANLCMGATASDTGGSIRQPAAFCGVTGIKPTYGLCSRFGMIAFASSLDQAGPIAKTVADCALMLENMAGFDPRDSTSLAVKIPNYYNNLTPKAKNLKIGIAKEYIDNLDGDSMTIFNKGVDILKSSGAEIIDISLKTTPYALPAYYIIAPAEASSNLARYDGIRYGFRADDVKNLEDLYKQTRTQGFGKEVKRRIMIGTYVLSAGYYDAYYTKALKVKKLIANDFDNAFKSVDVILTPTTPTAAFDMKNTNQDPISMYLNDIYTVTANLAGLPAISIPAGLSKDGMPLGLQLIGKRLDEQLLFDVGLHIENCVNFQYLQ